MFCFAHCEDDWNRHAVAIIMIRFDQRSGAKPVSSLRVFEFKPAWLSRAGFFTTARSGRNP